MQKFKTGINTWFFNLYISYYMYNNYTLFSNWKAKNNDFIIAARYIIQIEKISVIFILFISSNNI